MTEEPVKGNQLEHLFHQKLQFEILNFLVLFMAWLFPWDEATRQTSFSLLSSKVAQKRDVNFTLAAVKSVFSPVDSSVAIG